MRKVVAFFIQNPIWSNAIIVLTGLFGLISLFTMPHSFFPETTPRKVFVNFLMNNTIPSSLTRQTLFSITIETVVMGRDVAGGVEAVTVRINVVTADILYATIVPIADVVGRTVFVLLTATEMLVPIVPANREHVRAVVVVDATLESESGAE